MKPSPLAAVFLLAVSAPVLAHPAGHERDSAAKTAPPPPRTAIPESFSGVVSALSEQLTAAETALDAFKLADLHRSCASIAALSAAAPTKAETLDATDQATVETTATHLQEKVAEAVTTSTKGDIDAAKAAIADVRSDIDVLRGLVDAPNDEQP